MSVAADLVTLLKTFSAVTSLCVVNAKTSTPAIRPDRLSQSDVLTAALGGIEITTTEAEFQNGLDGSNKTSIVKVTAACVSRTSACSNAMADAVCDSLELFKGATTGGFIGSLTLDDRREDWASLDDGTDTGEYVVEVDFSVFYRRN